MNKHKLTKTVGFCTSQKMRKISLPAKILRGGVDFFLLYEKFAFSGEKSAKGMFL